MTSTEYPKLPHHILKLTDNPTDHETIILRSPSIIMSTLPSSNCERLIMSDELKYLTRLLSETLNESPNGVGVAAPQIGYNMAMFITRMPQSLVDAAVVQEIKEQPETIYINPIYELMGDETIPGVESCLSVEDKVGVVKRPFKIKVSYFNKDGKYIVDEILTGYNARVFLHEYDHLNGVLFIDKADQLYPRQEWIELLKSRRETNDVEWLNSVGFLK